MHVPLLGREMSKTPSRREHQKSSVNVTKSGNFISFLKNPISTLGESNLSTRGVLYSLHLEFCTTHCL